MKEQNGGLNENIQNQIQQAPKDMLKRKTSQLSEPILRYTYSNTSSASQFCMYQAAYDQFQVKFVEDQELFSEINSKIDIVSSIVNISNKEICMYLLQFYNWNQQKLGNNYFNDNWYSFTGRCYQYIQKKQQQTSLSKVQICQVCQQQKRLYSNGFCNHYYCKSCWSLYIKAELQQNRIFFNCMNSPYCQKSPILKGFTDIIAPQLSELYHKKIYLNYAIQNKDVCYCPNEKCHYFCVKQNMMEILTVNCICGQLYCFKCQKEPHSPAHCTQVQQWYNLVNSEQVNDSWIKNNTRQCPKCKNRIQKKVGCSHMRCIICQSEFCYQCNKLWDQYHAKSKGQCAFKSNLQVKVKVMNNIAELNNYLSEAMNMALKHKKMLIQCQQNLASQSDSIIKSRVIQLKSEVINAWMLFKWVKILICLGSKRQIQPLLQTALINSISQVMEPIDYLSKNYKSLPIKEMHQYGEQVLQKKQLLKRNTGIWLEAWQQISRVQSYDS